MEYFDTKVILDYETEGIPFYRRVVSSRLIDNRENRGDIDKIMDEEVLPPKKYPQ